MKWNPRFHPRNRVGKFIDVLNHLKDGGSVDLPDGTTVTRSGDSFQVRGGGQRSRGLTARRAAEQALDGSARGSHPDSLGGRTRFQSVAGFEAAQGQRPARLRMTRTGRVQGGQMVVIPGKGPAITKPFRAYDPQMGGDKVQVVPIQPERFGAAPHTKDKATAVEVPIALVHPVVDDPAMNVADEMAAALEDRPSKARNEDDAYDEVAGVVSQVADQFGAEADGTSLVLPDGRTVDVSMSSGVRVEPPAAADLQHVIVDGDGFPVIGPNDEALPAVASVDRARARGAVPGHKGYEVSTVYRDGNPVVKARHAFLDDAVAHETALENTNPAGAHLIGDVDDPERGYLSADIGEDDKVSTDAPGIEAVNVLTDPVAALQANGWDKSPTGNMAEKRLADGYLVSVNRTNWSIMSPGGAIVEQGPTGDGSALRAAVFPRDPSAVGVLSYIEPPVPQSPGAGPVENLPGGGVRANNLPVAPLRRGMSGALGSPVVAKTAAQAEIKARQLRSDLKTAEGKLAQAKLNGHQKSIRDNATVVSGWRGKLNAFLQTWPDLNVPQSPGSEPFFTDAHDWRPSMDGPAPVDGDGEVLRQGDLVDLPGGALTGRITEFAQGGVVVKTQEGDEQHYRAEQLMKIAGPQSPGSGGFGPTKPVGESQPVTSTAGLVNAMERGRAGDSFSYRGFTVVKNADGGFDVWQGDEHLAQDVGQAEAAEMPDWPDLQVPQSPGMDPNLPMRDWPIAPALPREVEDLESAWTSIDGGDEPGLVRSAEAGARLHAAYEKHNVPEFDRVAGVSASSDLPPWVDPFVGEMVPADALKSDRVWLPVKGRGTVLKTNVDENGNVESVRVQFADLSTVDVPAETEVKELAPAVPQSPGSDGVPSLMGKLDAEFPSYPSGSADAAGREAITNELRRRGLEPGVPQSPGAVAGAGFRRTDLDVQDAERGLLRAQFEGGDVIAAQARLDAALAARDDARKKVTSAVKRALTPTLAEAQAEVDAAWARIEAGDTSDDAATLFEGASDLLSELKRLR